MGMLIKGELVDSWLDKEIEEGEFRRMASTFRNWVTPDGSAGPTGEAGFKAEAGRYHLYISRACPWAHRTVIFRRLKGLESVIGVSEVEPEMLKDGWTFADSDLEACSDASTDSSPDFGPGRFIDTLHGFRFMHQVYTRADRAFTGQVTVPVLWDKQKDTIVNNESSEIIRMFNSAFDSYTDVKTDYYPEHLRGEIDAINQSVYDNINNGVYRCGFATTQKAYEGRFHKLFDELDRVEDILYKQRYLAGDRITEADWRLFTTLVRFDAVYYGHFKCNRKRITDYPNLSNYVRELYQVPGISDTIDIDYIKRHYYFSHTSINPTQIVPLGPELDFAAPHDRAGKPVA